MNLFSTFPIRAASKFHPSWHKKIFLLFWRYHFLSKRSPPTSFSVIRLDCSLYQDILSLSLYIVSLSPLSSYQLPFSLSLTQWPFYFYPWLHYLTPLEAYSTLSLLLVSFSTYSYMCTSPSNLFTLSFPFYIGGLTYICKSLLLYLACGLALHISIDALPVLGSVAEGY